VRQPGTLAALGRVAVARGGHEGSHAALALANLLESEQGGHAFALLEAVLQGGSEQVRASLAAGLGWRGAPDDVARRTLLDRCASDASPVVRDAAAAARARIAGRRPE
jgi:hypothetical protein